MLKAVNFAQYNTNFHSKRPKDDINENETHTLPNTVGTRFNQETQRVMSAFIDYPAKGLRGDVNANFYEFLTMGIVPYLLGSAMFMLLFNVLNLGKHLGARDAKESAKLGRKMALGVVFYGLLKSLSKNLVTLPIKMATGVDTEMPYQNKVYNLPKGAGENAGLDIRWQQRKVFDSKEFFRKDLLKRDYFDNVARKLGLGDDLNDSISETTPIIQNIVATTNTAKSLSSYCWAAVGVALASQDAWTDFFDAFSNRKPYVVQQNESLLSRLSGKFKNTVKNTWVLTQEFVKDSGRACKQLWEGNPAYEGFMKHAGKSLLIFSALTTVFLTSNSIIRARHMAKNNNKNTIDKSKESTVI